MYVLIARRHTLTVNYSSPKSQPHTEPIAVEHPEKARKGSVFLDQSHRKESVAQLTENLTGECVVLPSSADTY